MKLRRFVDITELRHVMDLTKRIVTPNQTAGRPHLYDKSPLKVISTMRDDLKLNESIYDYQSEQVA